MAIAKPTETGEWGQAGIEPSAPQKATGFVPGNTLPAQWLNWAWYTWSSWLAWLNQYWTTSGTGDRDITFTAPTAGDATFAAGPLTGTNAHGGTMYIAPGACTGNGHSSLHLQAVSPGASGEAVRTPISYMIMNGETQHVDVKGDLHTEYAVLADGDITLQGNNKLTRSSTSSTSSADGAPAVDVEGQDAVGYNGGHGVVATGGSSPTAGKMPGSGVYATAGHKASGTSSNGWAVRGRYASDNSGNGVWGEANAADTAGVYGSNASSGDGVKGYSVNGIGVYGISPSNGVGGLFRCGSTARGDINLEVKTVLPTAAQVGDIAIYDNGVTYTIAVCVDDSPLTWKQVTLS